VVTCATKAGWAGGTVVNTSIPKLAAALHNYLHSRTEPKHIYTYR